MSFLNTNVNNGDGSVPLVSLMQGGTAEVSTMVQTPLLQLPGLAGSVSMQSDDMTNFGIGVSTSNYASINITIVQAFTQRFPRLNAQREMLIFAERATMSPRTNLKYEYEIASLHELNAYLLRPENRRKYGNERTAERLMTDFGFAGSMNQKNEEWLERNQGVYTSVIAGRRARCTAVTRACTRKYSNVGDRYLDNVFLLCVRRSLSEDDLSCNFGTIDASQGDQYYWQFHVHVQDSPAPPSPWLYIDDDSVGGYIRVGTIVEVSPNNKLNPSLIATARESLDGKANRKRELAYLENTVLLPYVDIFLGM